MPKPLKVYAYSKCDTCRKALRLLRDRNVVFHEVAIRDSPPSVAELKAMAAAYGTLRKLFNTSGADYKTLGLSARLPSMSEEEAFSLLADNGNLVKRPFVIGHGVHLVGFNVAEWQSVFPGPC